MESRVCLMALVLALIARFQALLPGYSIDDYMFVNQGLPPWFDPSAAANGRAMSYVLFAALARLDAAPPRAAVLFIVLLTVVLIGVGIAACRLWRLSDNFAASLIVVCFVVLHPYQAEMFTFRTASMIVAIPLAMSFGAILICPQSKPRWLVAVLCLASAISIYQTVLNYAAMVVLFRIAFQLGRQGRPPAEWFRHLRSQLALIAAAAGVYLVFTAVVIRMSGVALGSRTAILGPSEIGNRISVFASSAFRMLALTEPVFPSATKAILVLTFVVGFVAMLLRRQLDTPRHAVVLVMTALAGAPLCFGLMLVLREWYAPPRILSQTSLYCAGMMAMLYSYSGRRTRRMIAGGCALVFLSFIGINDQIFADQLRVNLRDFAEANRIVQRIESLPDFREIRSVAIAGGRWGYASPIRTVQNDMNISALFAEWAKIGVLNEASGYAFGEAAPDMKAKALEYCRSSPKWPAGESITRIDSVAVVCLPPD